MVTKYFTKKTILVIGFIYCISVVMSSLKSTTHLKGSTAVTTVSGTSSSIKSSSASYLKFKKKLNKKSLKIDEMYGDIVDHQMVHDDGKSSGEPSYIRLCQGLLEATSSSPQDGEIMNDRSIQKGKREFKIVYEDPNLCSNLSVKNGKGGNKPLWTHEALLSIFGSAFLSHAHSLLLRRVGHDNSSDDKVAPDAMHYSHKCQDPNFIQGYMPDNLIPNRNDHHTEAYAEYTIGLALEVCELCTSEYRSTGECSLFPSSSSWDSQKVLGSDLRTKFTKSILPYLRYNVRLASEAFREHLRENSNTLWWNKDFITKRSKYLPDEDGAIIYISENDFDDDGTFLVPFYLYAERIARSTGTDIQIFVTEGCSNNVVCLSYTNSLRDYLIQMYPRCVASIDRVNALGSPDSTAITVSLWYARMILSSHLICATGDMECTHAAMIKNGEAYATVLLREKEQVYVEEIIRPNPFRFLLLIPTDKKPNLNINNGVVTTNEHVSLSDQVEEFALQHPPDRSRCRYLRGRAGHWEQDMEYAKLAQYKTPISFYAGKADRLFVPTENEPFRLPTTYKWIDALYPQCQTELVTLEGLCDVMQRLGVGRILLVGDSLTWQSSESLHKLLGATDDAHEGHSLKSWVATFKCPNGANEIQIQALRNDELNKIAEEPMEKKPNCGIMGYCMPWINEYTSNPVPTVLIANAGAHIDDIVRFRSLFYDFLNIVDSADRSDDIVFFRTSVPGHRDCMKEGIQPFYYYHEYQARETKKWNWDMFYKHNNYVDRTLNDRAARGDARIPIELLDVYPMTVLRPDGHASSSDCENQCGRADDCLHYSLPGPPDWWSHLLYSNLLDLAREKEVIIR